MICRGDQVISWDAENRPVAISDIQGITTFTYDGDGNRGEKTVNGETVIYVNKYYEKDLTTDTVTTYYYLGGRLVALRNGTDLRYMHQDSLGSSSVVTDASGDLAGSMKYFPYGDCRNSEGSLDTDKQFTGQRLRGNG